MRRYERLKSLPRDLMEKVLMDALNTWARQADERKGATRYNVAVLSANVLQKDVLEREDYLVAIDILRSKAYRVLETISEIDKLPGAVPSAWGRSMSRWRMSGRASRTSFVSGLSRCWG